MDVLGIGPLELLVILVIALIVVGPERLPEIAGSIGKTVRQIRAVSSGLTAEWQREISAATQDLQVDDLKKSLLDPLAEASADVQKTLDAPSSSPTPSPAASRTAPPGGFVMNPSPSVAGPETPGPISSPIVEPQEVAESAGDVQPQVVSEDSDLPDIVEEDAHAES